MGSSMSKPSTAYYSTPLPAQNRSAFKDEPDEKQALFDLYSTNGSSPHSLDGTITAGNLRAWEATADTPTQTLARTVLRQVSLDVLQRPKIHIRDAHIFNLEVDFKTTPIANQRMSGRCWLFASTNVLRYNIMKKLNLGEFELSQVMVHSDHLCITHCSWNVELPLLL
jgi:bleomycin hydrolase